MSRFVNSNGLLLDGNSHAIMAGNRGHLYGDGLFETIRVLNNVPVNLEHHLNRMFEGMKILSMVKPSDFSVAFFEREIQALLIKNNIKSSARIRLSIDRKIGGHYLPLSNDVEYFIEADPVIENRYVLNGEGLKIELFQDIKKQINILSPYKTKNCLIYIMAKIKGNELGMDELLIQNDKMGIIESASSNLFIVSNGVLYTPGIDLGCLGGTMRMQIINLALEHNIKVYECNISPQHLLTADEIFLTNAIQGISWVSTYRTKEYSNEVAKRLINFLNEKWHVS
ncbi:aminotransferase class IV [Crocinitomix catalasitica]|uniref:aminotransferase class IV n=1 Tax=Crocinitomix catalasitica TaxID=184607 RepID=UPI000685BAE3|nr:aminotransferase class IV [Crocinitomix catalasitica]